MASTARDTIATPASNTAKPIRSSEDFLIFGAPLICDEEKREILGCLETGWLGTGRKSLNSSASFAITRGRPMR